MLACSFLPRINKSLSSFVESWNNHPLTTAHNLTPNQLFVQGAIETNMMPTQPIPTTTTNQYSLPSFNDAVDVPRSMFIPCNALEQELEQIDILKDVDDLGYGI